MKFARPTATLLTFILLCASVAYWIMQMLQNSPRSQANNPEPPPAPISAAASLFGGSASGANDGNFQLKGIINASNASDSTAIIALNGKPLRPARVGTELAPGVTIKQVNEKYVLLTENGVEKRLELAAVQRKAAPTAASVTPAVPAPSSSTPANTLQPLQPSPPPMPRQPSAPSESMPK